jgi:hypothetical protein
MSLPSADIEREVAYDCSRRNRNVVSQIVYLFSSISERFVQKSAGEAYRRRDFWPAYLILLLLAVITWSKLAWAVTIGFAILEVWSDFKSERDPRPHPWSDGVPRFSWLSPAWSPQEFKFFVQPFIVIMGGGVMGYFSVALGTLFSLSGVCMLFRHMGFLELQAVRLEVLQDEQAAMERRIERLNQQLRVETSEKPGI